MFLTSPLIEQAISLRTPVSERYRDYANRRYGLCYAIRINNEA